MEIKKGISLSYQPLNRKVVVRFSCGYARSLTTFPRDLLRRCFDKMEDELQNLRVSDYKIFADQFDILWEKARSAPFKSIPDSQVIQGTLAVGFPFLETITKCKFALEIKILSFLIF